jgi:tRNA (guanine37-N1)-methyltransferase
MSVEKKAKSYKEIVELPEDLKNILPTSFDIIGDIALLKIPDELQKYKKDIADAFLKTYKNIKTVCEIKPVSGELRTRTIKIIGGEKKLETIHKEYNARFKVNVEKTYFSPRLANERKKIADTVRKNEVIVDMFAGVAPFPIIIAKHADPKIIYAIEKNKDAVKYAKENIKINNLLDKIEVIHTDAKNTYKILSEKNVKADRIIMNLPFSAYLFFEEALKIAGDECIIHYFDFLKDTEIKDRIKQLKNIAEKNNVILTKTVYEKIKSYSPREFYIRIDITAKKT